MDELLDVTAVRTFLAAAADPAVALQAALIGDDRPDPDDPEIRRLRAAVHTRPRVVRLFEKQADDGSWGKAQDTRRRILPTLWMVKILAELGVTADHPGLARALDFLVEHAVVGGGMSISGRREGVLPCYTGLLADTLLRAGRPDDAAAPLRWLVTYQQVRYGGHDYLGHARPVWGDYLTERYGGCFAGTTCLLGVIKCGLALTRARDAGLLGPDADGLLTAIRDLLADRELFRRRNGAVIPLSASRTASGEAAERWLAPAFPLTYQTDLVEVAQLAAELEVPVGRMAPALERIAAWRLPDGTWPMLRRCSAATWYQPERPARGTGSHWISLRVLRLSERLRKTATAPADRAPLGPV